MGSTGDIGTGFREVHDDRIARFAGSRDIQRVARRPSNGGPHCNMSSIVTELNEIAIQRIQKNSPDALESLVAGIARR
jgi:hypothetical protein